MSELKSKFEREEVLEKVDSDYGDLIAAIKEYRIHRKSYDAEKLLDLKDRIELARFYLADYYAYIRAKSEGDEHFRKIEMSETYFEHRENMTQGDSEKKARIESRERVNKLLESAKIYQKLRMQLDISENISHNIAKRINLITQ